MTILTHNYNEIIKKELNNHLNLKIDFQQPSSLFEGHIKVGVYWDEDLISETEEIIKHSFFLIYERVF